MARLPGDPRLPQLNSPNYDDNLRWQLDRILRQAFLQVNLLTEGRVDAVTNAYTAAPTTGEHSQGDFVRNSSPSEQGSSGSKYIVQGWLCVASGEPGTWVESRCLTGN